MTKYLPLAPNQLDIYMDQILHGDSPLYNIGGYFKFKGVLDKQILEQAIQAMVDQNDALRILIHQQNGQPVQEIEASRKYSLLFTDFSQQADSNQKCLDFIQEEFKTNFPLHEKQLFKTYLTAASDQTYYITFESHHIAADGWTAMLHFKHMVEIYNALIQKQAIPSFSSYCYQDYIADSQRYLASKKFQHDAEFWNNYITELPEPLFQQSNRSDQSDLSVSKIDYQNYHQLQLFSKSQQATIFHVLLSGLALYLYRTYGKKQFIVGLPILNRKQINKETPGPFVNMLPFLIHIEPHFSFLDLLETIKADLKKVYRYQRYPLKQIIKNFNLRQQARETVFDVIFSYEKEIFDHQFINTRSAGGAVQVFSQHCPHLLAVTLCEFHQQQDVDLIFEYHQALFSQAEISLFSKRFKHILKTITHSAASPLNDLDIIPNEEKQRLLTDFNSAKQYQFERSIIGLFEQQAEKTPNAIALRFNQQSLNYQQLNQYAHHLAQTLINKGAKPNTIIAILLPRSFEMIISVLAVLKTGAAYLPLDIESPLQRIQFMLDDTETKIVISQTQLSTELKKQNLQIIDYSMPSATALAEQQQTAIQFKNKADNLAYVIYTSGSTGKPKGVLIPQAALYYRLKWAQQCFKMTPNDVLLQVFKFNFDPSVYEIFSTLISGATLVLPPEGRQSAESLAILARDEQVSIATFVPSLLEKFLDSEQAKQCAQLRLVVSGGEVLTTNLSQRFFQQLSARLINVYGPTEATIIASYQECFADNKQAQIAIGKALPNTQLYVLDRQLKPLGIGCKGELYIGGDGIALGYLNRPDLDKEKFINNPFKAGKLYKTGDLASFRHDGSLDFFGRIDRQVKLRGFRVELGEIEQVLCQYPGVKQAAICLHTVDQKTQLDAYLVADNKIENERLRQFLSKQLPDYMLPQSYNFLNSFPLTINHKIDYQQLKVPENKQPSKNKSNHTPLNSTESLLLYLWEKVLDIEPISTTDNFFDLGGDSYSALSIIAELESLIDQPLSIALIFEHPTIAQIATKLNDLNIHTAHSSLLNLVYDKTKPAFFCIASGHGDIIRFSNLAQNLAHDYAFYMLQPPLIKQDQQMLAALVEEYSQQILKTAQPPYRIAGFSISGVIALEVARKLKSQGHQTQPPILIDSIYPIAPRLVYYCLKWMRLYPQWVFWKNVKIHGRKQSILYTDSGLLAQIWAVSQHRINSYPGDISLISSSALQRFYRLLFQPWHGLIEGKIKHFVCPGNHGNLFSKQHSAKLAEFIRQCFEVSSKK